MRRLLVTTAFLLLALPLHAALDKYKNWLDSSEAAFLTDAERAEWKRVRDDAAAQLFIAKYVDRRGGMAFKALVEHRTGIANKFFSSGQVKGAFTLRGRLVLLLGAPARIEAGEPYPRNRAPRRSAPPVAALSGSGNIGGGLLSTSASRRTAVIPMSRLVALTFSPETVITVEVDDDGKERLAEGTNRRKLDALLDAAIQASVRKP